MHCVLIVDIKQKEAAMTSNTSAAVRDADGDSGGGRRVLSKNVVVHDEQAQHDYEAVDEDMVDRNEDGDDDKEEDVGNLSGNEEAESLSESSLVASRQSQSAVNRRSRRAIAQPRNYDESKDNDNFDYGEEIMEEDLDDDKSNASNEKGDDDDDYIEPSTKRKRPRSRMWEDDENGDGVHDRDDDWSVGSEEEDVEDEEEDDEHLKRRRTKREKAVPVSEYEKKRLKNVERNEQRLRALGLLGEVCNENTDGAKKKKKPKKSSNEQRQPERKSDRSRKAVSYAEEEVPSASDIEKEVDKAETAEDDISPSIDALPTLKDFKPFKGMRIQKDFDGILYGGKVGKGPTKVKDNGGVTLEWNVLFDDGDREDMDREELYQCWKIEFEQQQQEQKKIRTTEKEKATTESDSDVGSQEYEKTETS